MAGHYHQTQLLTADKVWDKIDFIGLLLDNPLDDVAGLPAGQAVRLQQVPDSRHSLMLGPESHSEEHLAPGLGLEQSKDNSLVLHPHLKHSHQLGDQHNYLVYL